MKLLIQIFGEGKDLDTLQMSCRGIVVFLIALVLIRVSGRRSFGLHTPFDNIITILLGAVLSRGVVGASAFLPTIVASAVIVGLHRIFGHLAVRNKSFRRWTEGEKILLFKNNRFIEAHMSEGLVSKEDIMQGVRESALTEDMDDIEAVYLERNGQISAVKKKRD